MKHTPSLIPVVEVKEIDSVLQVPSGGGTVMLGGLMETRTNVENTKLPFAGDIPIFGKLFTAQSEITEVVELVILLKVTVVDRETDELDLADQRLLNNYTQDPRSLSQR